MSSENRPAGRLVIISGPSEDHSPLYMKINTLIPTLRPMEHPQATRGANIMARKVSLGGEEVEIEAALDRAEAPGSP